VNCRAAIVSAFLFVCPSAWAAPTAAQASEVVDKIISVSLDDRGEVRMPAEWKLLAPHKAYFDPEFYTLLEWCETPHPDAEGRAWHVDVDSIWQVQVSGVRGLKVGQPKPEGDLQTVVVDYDSPSFRESVKPTRYHSVWVIGESEGKPVLKDIRYHVKYPEQTNDGTALADMKKARANFKAP
jgi:hypothetical protein